MQKATFRLPEWEMAKLRERSRAQRRPLNTVAAEVIAAGLGHRPEDDELLRRLGSFVARPALTPYRGIRSVNRPDADLDEALEWARGD